MIEHIERRPLNSLHSAAEQCPVKLVSNPVAVRGHKWLHGCSLPEGALLIGLF